MEACRRRRRSTSNLTRLRRSQGRRSSRPGSQLIQPLNRTGPGLAQISLGYTGSIPEGSEIAKLAATLQNPWQLEETKGSLADDMRIKLLYDLAYTASLERFDTYLRTELGIIFKTPLVMLKMTQGR
jgi:hypothetical protein